MTYTYKLLPNVKHPITGDEVECQEVVRKEDNWHIPKDPKNECTKNTLDG